MTDPMRIVHCDDSGDILVLFEHWLEDHPDLELVASARGVREAIEEALRHQPDVIVTDTMGMTGSPDFLGWLHDAAPAADLVLFTGYEAFQLDPAIVERVDRIVTKRVDETELVAALRSLRAA